MYIDQLEAWEAKVGEAAGGMERAMARLVAGANNSPLAA